MVQVVSRMVNLEDVDEEDEGDISSKDKLIQGRERITVGSVAEKGGLVVPSLNMQEKELRMFPL